jgi:hypothetical protein
LLLEGAIAMNPFESFGDEIEDAYMRAMIMTLFADFCKNKPDFFDGFVNGIKTRQLADNQKLKKHEQEQAEESFALSLIGIDLDKLAENREKLINQYADDFTLKIKQMIDKLNQREGGASHDQN